MNNLFTQAQFADELDDLVRDFKYHKIEFEERPRVPGIPADDPADLELSFKEWYEIFKDWMKTYG